MKNNKIKIKKNNQDKVSMKLMTIKRIPTPKLKKLFQI